MLCKEGFILTVFSTVINQLSCSEIAEHKYTEGFPIAKETLTAFINMFTQCAGSAMPSQRFLMDDLKGFVNYPSKTTVGFAPKFTSNRKFFANMISTVGFKDMMANDEEELRKDFVKKLRYCDNAVMDENIMKELYDREVDQSKI